jgi:hypothetical protein
MPTRNIVPRANNEGKIGTANKKWNEGHFGKVFSNGLIYLVYNDDVANNGREEGIMKQCQVDLTGFSKAILESEGYIEVNNSSLMPKSFEIFVSFEFNGSLVISPKIASTLLERELFKIPFALKYCGTCQTELNDIKVRIQFMNLPPELSLIWCCYSLRVYGVI